MIDRTRDKVPSELLDPVVDYFRPRQVILFGSGARGDAGPDSDIDLLVVLDDDAPNEMLTLAAGFEARRSCRSGADVIPCRASVFASKAPIPGTLAFKAATEGIVVYQRPGE
ncbi:MAG: nucleotidyltransferase family protein [Acetobacteraceae bacterium]